jgi:peptidoglycan/LPS O-acetylase OafA/YrhL
MSTAGLPTSAPQPGQSLLRRILMRPSTRLGWWSVALAAAFVVLFIIDLTVFLPSTAPSWRQAATPFYGIALMSWGLVAGVVGLTAVIRQHERSWLVWLTILLGLMGLAVDSLSGVCWLSGGSLPFCMG